MYRGILIFQGRVKTFGASALLHKASDRASTCVALDYVQRMPLLGAVLNVLVVLSVCQTLAHRPARLSPQCVA